MTPSDSTPAAGAVGRRSSLLRASGACIASMRAIALGVARGALAGCSNVELHTRLRIDLPLAPASMDSVLVGVLHHVPSTNTAIAACVSRLVRARRSSCTSPTRSTAGALVSFGALFRLATALRRQISRSPHRRKLSSRTRSPSWSTCRSRERRRPQERMGHDVAGGRSRSSRDRSFYTMRNDALDQFGTRLEQRFTKQEIVDMLAAAGLVDVVFSPQAPVLVCVRRRGSVVDYDALSYRTAASTFPAFAAREAAADPQALAASVRGSEQRPKPRAVPSGAGRVLAP